MNYKKLLLATTFLAGTAGLAGMDSAKADECDPGFTLGASDQGLDPNFGQGEPSDVVDPGFTDSNHAVVDPGFTNNNQDIVDPGFTNPGNQLDQNFGQGEPSDVVDPGFTNPGNQLDPDFGQGEPSDVVDPGFTNPGHEQDTEVGKDEDIDNNFGVSTPNDGIDNSLPNKEDQTGTIPNDRSDVGDMGKEDPNDPEFGLIGDPSDPTMGKDPNIDPSFGVTHPVTDPEQKPEEKPSDPDKKPSNPKDPDNKGQDNKDQNQDPKDGTTKDENNGNEIATLPDTKAKTGDVEDPTVGTTDSTIDQIVTPVVDNTVSSTTPTIENGTISYTKDGRQSIVAAAKDTTSAKSTEKSAALLPQTGVKEEANYVVAGTMLVVSAAAMGIGALRRKRA